MTHYLVEGRLGVQVQKTAQKPSWKDRIEDRYTISFNNEHWRIVYIQAVNDRSHHIK